MVSTENLDIPSPNDGKVEIAGKKKNLDRSKINNKKSIQSSRAAEGNTTLRTGTLIVKYGSSERRPQGISSSKKAKVLVSSGKNKTSKKFNQVILMADKRSITITTDDSKDQPLIGEKNMHDVTSSNTSSVRDPAVQNKMQSPKYRRASSPASYVFFALENKETSIIVQVNGCTKRYTQDASTGVKSRIIGSVSSESANIASPCSGGNKEYIRFHKGSSELALLQEILSDSKNVTSDSQPFSSQENSEETRAQHRADDDDDIKEAHGDLAHINDKLCSQDDGEAIKSSESSYISYETDSTLDEECIFSDTSLDLSLSEDEDFDSSSKFDVLSKGPERNQEKHNVDVMKKSKHQIRRHRGVESFSKNSIIFERSLAAIHNGDNRTLRHLCQSHFFLLSITDEEGKTLLHHAAARENPSICQVLLDTNIGLVNIDQQDKFGKTALYYAMEKGNLKTIKIILDNGAKAEIPDKRCKTVLDAGLPKDWAK